MSTMTLERRQVARPVELRASDSGPGTLYGYAAVFNQFSQNLGGYVEQVDPAGFNKTLGDGLQVLCRYNHDDNQLLGTTEAQTLRLSVDGTGLAYEDDLPDTGPGRDVGVLGKRGDLKYSSFAFYTIEDDWGITPNGFPLRTLRAVQLIDVAPVNSPAYLDSSVGIRSLAERLQVDVGVVEHAKTAELRSLILGEPIDISAVESRSEEQDDDAGRETTTGDLAMQRRRLDLEHLK